jgi:hypothetical protein
MSTVHNQLNRPVHLARRDAFYERGVELLFQPLQHMATATRIQHLQQVMDLLSTAKQHAFFAYRGQKPAQKEVDFHEFLKLILDNVQSIHSMMLHQSHLEEAESFLCQFLNTSSEQCQLPAMHYRRRAEDLMQGLWQMMQLAYAPYRTLQASFRESASPEELARYQKAFSSFEEETRTRFPNPTAA